MFQRLQTTIADTFLRTFCVSKFMLCNNDVNVSTTTTALCSSRHVCNFVLHHVQRQFAPCLLGNFCNAKYAQCYVTFRQTPEICLKMLTAVAFWGIFCNYTILTMLSVSTTIINLLQILFKDFFYYRILSVQQRR